MKVGLIVNPYAGSGGRIGYKGSDDLRIENPEIESRVKRFLDVVKNDIEFISPRFKMGEYFLRKFGRKYTTINSGKENSTREDTVTSARMLSDLTNLIVFVGGDGTARDVVEGTQSKIPILGVPAGVKMHSGVFAANPETAGMLVSAYVKGMAKIVNSEVMDIDEDSYRKGIYKIKLYYITKTINFEGLLVSSKEEVISPSYELDEIAEYVIDNMKDSIFYIMGPGSTVKAIEEKLGYFTNFLSTDLFLGKKLLKSGVNYMELLQLIGELKIVLTPIGGQGFLIGRGNQEIGPEILRRTGKDNIIIVSSKEKISRITCLRIDSGEATVDKMLEGIYKVIVGYNEFYTIRTCSMT
ncbi:ATP-NAD kinase family protein [Acidianus sp. HS-5]|uniref:ATP-NAD kinase family protein n=1 Tax=Acidianus sp. HS-5 TaxID=2886040 RepID=UPI001F30C679|nr:ATP-NAD kinase family protein [Acidianus sp. HS-5]BDC19890.1 ATP-NAD kinase [Acidianus sp. HS-5]